MPIVACAGGHGPKNAFGRPPTLVRTWAPATFWSCDILVNDMAQLRSRERTPNS